MATLIGSPRVPSTVGSSLVTPVARDAVEPDESAHAARRASHASLAGSASASVLCCMRRFCHALLLRRLARSTPACLLLLMLVLCLRCLLFLRLPVVLRTLLFRPIVCLVLCPFVGIQRALGPSSGRSGPDDGGPPISDYGPALGRDGGSWRCLRSGTIRAIAQGVADTQADLEILRNGVADIAESLENKIRDMWDLAQAEVRSEHDQQQHLSDVARERRIADPETSRAVLSG